MRCRLKYVRELEKLIQDRVAGMGCTVEHTGYTKKHHPLFTITNCTTGESRQYAGASTSTSASGRKNCACEIKRICRELTEGNDD